MAKFVKNGAFVNIVELKDNEILALLKINIPCRFNFGDTGKSIDLFNRLENNGINFISVIFNDGENEVIGYDILIAMITSNLADGPLTVVMKKQDFQLKEPLLLMLGDLKKELIGSCMMIDYNLQNHVYSIINKKTSEGLSDKLYYFEDNNSILAFTKDGPVLLYGQTQSIEELICN